MKTLLARLTEPSSWAAIAVLLAAVGVPPALVQVVHLALGLAPDVIQQLAVLGAAGAGIGLAERKADSAPPPAP